MATENDDILDGGAEPDPNDFRNQIPEEFREHTALQDIKDMRGLVSSYINAQQLVGRDKIPLPGKDATDEDWNNVFAKLGRPESPDGYEWDPSKADLPEGFEVNEDFVRDFKAKAHAAGLTKRQAEKLLTEYHQMVAADFVRTNDDMKMRRAEWEKELKKEFGAAFGERMNLAREALENFGGDELRDTLKKAGIASHPGIIKILAKLGELTSEGVSDPSGGGSRFKMTPGMAKEEISKLRADAEFNKIYLDPNHPEHKSSVERMQRLFQIAYSE